LRRAGNHRAWSAVAAVADETAPLAFSSVTVADLDDLVAALTVAPSRAIPVAARSLVLELVCRSHFVPFSVTVAALLARLYVIERRLCVELSAAASAMRVVLAVGGGPEAAALPSASPGTGLSRDEDVGEPIGASAALNPGSAARAEAPLAPSTPAPTPKMLEAPSLYDLMATDDCHVASVVQAMTQNRAATGRAPPPIPFGKPSAMPGKASALPGPADKPVENVSEGGGGGGAPGETTSRCAGKVDEDDEDIDDIFGDL
jgi:hypothetical protein